MKSQQIIEKNIQRVIIIAIIVVLNLLSIFVFYRIDLTKSKSYTLSKSTKVLLSQAKEEIRIKLFFSKNIPSELLSTKNYVKDLLSEYQSVSKGKLVFEFVDSSNDTKFKSDASTNGIPSITIQVMEKDKMEYRDIYIGMVLSYRNLNEKIPVISSGEGLEFIVSSALKRLIFPEQQHIAYFTPISLEESKRYEDLPEDPSLDVLYQMLKSNYLFDRTDLFFPLPEDTNLLIVNGIVDSLHEVQLYLLDQYIMSGKPIMIFQDRFVGDINENKATLIDNNFTRYLFKQGLYLKPNLVLDAYCYQISKYRKQGEYTVPVSFDYPFFPVIQNRNLNHPISKDLPLVQALFSSEIFYKENPNLHFTPLLMSSSSSYEMMGKEIDINYEQFQDLKMADAFIQEPKVIAGIYNGQLESGFKHSNMRHDQFIERCINTNIFLAGSTSFVDNTILSNVKGNADFVINSIDFLCQNSGLIEMRKRNISYSPLVKTTEGLRFYVKVANFAIPFMMLVITGIIYWIMNQRHKKSIIKLTRQ